MKKRIALSFCLLAALLLGGCGGKDTTQDATQDTADESQNEQMDSSQDVAEGVGTHHVEITIKDMGTIKVELDGDAAPITVQNFLDLASSVC